MVDIVILTGAGISAESGIETFRAETGLWAQHRIDDVCTPEALRRNPQLVHDFYNGRRAQLAEVAPNPAHLHLAAFCRAHAGRILLVTQNVDDLHERAGQPNLLHMHGALLSLKCDSCEHRQHHEGDSTPQMLCPSCGQGSLRPDIVFFGEIPYQMEEIQEALAKASLFVAIGTSGNVYPAAGFAQLARHYGADTWLVNLDPAQNNSDFTRFFQGKAGELMPEVVTEMEKWLG